ncbi:MAG: hypothetical protein R3321_00965, partial [Nitrososphaeraceae archaeon]|nr:hypothetical protein [Nitrososphaeraceae archaeon]
SSIISVGLSSCSSTFGDSLSSLIEVSSSFEMISSSFKAKEKFKKILLSHFEGHTWEEVVERKNRIS